MSSVIVRNETRGKDLAWRSIKINKSLDEICHTLEAELAPPELANVRRHDRVSVRFKNPLVTDSPGGRRITTVCLDEITAVANNEKHIVQIKGRSPARDIIDSTWSGMLGEMTLREIVRSIGGEFGIVCDSFPTDGPDPTGPVYEFSWNDESPWARLVTEADTQHFILTSNEAGNLYLWKVAVGTRSEPFAITEGVNMISAEWRENGAEQFHEYLATGGYEICDPVIDDSCPKGRRLMITIPYPLITLHELEERAKTEMRRRREVETVITVPGWGLTDPQIRSLGGTNEKEIFWVPNLLTPVDIPSLGLRRNLLVSSVIHEADGDGFFTSVTLVNREKYL